MHTDDITENKMEGAGTSFSIRMMKLIPFKGKLFVKVGAKQTKNHSMHT